MHRIGSAFELLAHHGGIVPAVRRRSLRVLTAVEREDISRGLASGSLIRDIAKGLSAPVDGELGGGSTWRSR